MKKTTGLLCVFALLVATASPTLAIPGMTGNQTDAKPAPTVSPKKLKCKKGETAKRIKKNGKSKYICVKLKAGVQPDATLYQQARLLANEGEYEWALDHLRLISNQNDAEVLNYTGYANRKAGRVETGISYYLQSLALNPNYVQAREYLGEAYVLAGFAAKAQDQLLEIKLRCGNACQAYTDLKNFIQSNPH